MQTPRQRAKGRGQRRGSLVTKAANRSARHSWQRRHNGWNSGCCASCAICGRDGGCALCAGSDGRTASGVSGVMHDCTRGSI
ncbi:hypothetical protein SESBI_43116 [Sesbania bispinosa]|nr:hypothetical protein SESBI_43116 [Sesbania bispinosa]